MDGRAARRRSLGLAFAAVAAFGIGGCDMVAGSASTGASPDASQAAAQVDLLAVGTAAQIHGPWQLTPFQLPANLIARIDDACRRQNIDFPKNLQVVVIDARGEHVAQIYYASPNGDSAMCADMTITETGAVEALGGAGWGANSRPWRVLGPLELVITDQSGSGRPATASNVAGRVGAGIARVELVLADGRAARATLFRGWFAVWFPGDLRGASVRGYDVFGAEVARFDL